MATTKEVKNIKVKEVKAMDTMKDIEKQLKNKIAQIGNKIIVNNVTINGKELYIQTPDKGNKRIIPVLANLQIMEELKWKKLDDGSILAIVCEGKKRSCFWLEENGKILCANISASSFNAVYAKIKGTTWERGNRVYKVVVGRMDGLPKGTKELISEEEIFGGN